MKRLISVVAGVASMVLLAAPHAAQAQDREFGGEIELVDPDVLRVCADPNNMPFSNQAEEGFEQAVARFLAEKLGRKSVSYAYFPQATGFVRMTLGANVCDLIISYPQGDELVQNTNAYYRTAYALVYPSGGELDGVESLSDPKLKDKRVGIIAGTPPGSYLARAGLMGRAKAYQLMIDTRVDNSAKAMIDDLASGEIDAAVLWGPMAGYYAKQAERDYTVVPLHKEAGGAAMAFRITMGVRPADQEWKRTLNRAIAQHQDEINEILLSYGVPLLDEEDRPILSKTGQAAQEAPGPDGDTAPAAGDAQ
ncbi:substrate-binding domain-containing protein [Aurantimonas endophytica]|uniref:Quinoprotein dehydrogenase-associated probable ABC transporter substrate-binding protein n=1 Tax=Aurantimonas endophytica TaxID=1522175 RepID=A0A7W6HDS2_9HYPH|nr:substrate-binding domain-containing protein [Aurantimonas endophytica]MBB4003366.1 quinoprotein dehydrogenase-associated probable ABC transporter substrate-binding protein [Aurantimonas endophytica]MCO6404227.1 quinoprotein dehydrogenase-associated putative ABC transporter substrate-binding protein [Aurantimonas endophytica]